MGDAMTAPNKGTGEPVAWRQQFNLNGKCWWQYTDGPNDPRSVHATGLECEPLYTRAPAQDAAVAELIEEQLFAAIEHGDADHRAWLRGKMRDFFAAFAANKATPT